MLEIPPLRDEQRNISYSYLNKLLSHQAIAIDSIDQTVQNYISQINKYIYIYIYLVHDNFMVSSVRMTAEEFWQELETSSERGVTFDTSIAVVAERRRKRLDKSTTKISITLREEKKEREKKVETAVWNMIQKLHSPLNKHKTHEGKAVKRPVIL